MKINTVLISTPSSLKVGIEKIYSDDSGRTEDGTLFLSLITTKRKLYCEWSYLSNADLSTLLTAMDDDFITIEYPDPLTGAARSGTFQPATKESNIFKMDSSTKAATGWENLTCNFIEQ